MATKVEDHLNPGETVAAAMARRIKMHEFLMTGGVSEGYVNGVLTYSKPIVVSETPQCPFHKGDCDAWEEIRAGHGQWTKLEADLANAEEQLKMMRGNKNVTAESKIAVADKITELKAKLAERPRDALALRSRTDAEFEAERAAAAKLAPKRGVYAAAGPKTGGNPWDKPGKSQKQYDPWPTGNSNHPVIKHEDDTRDVAEAAASSLAIEGDTIEIEGDEDE